MKINIYFYHPLIGQRNYEEGQLWFGYYSFIGS